VAGVLGMLTVLGVASLAAAQTAEKLADLSIEDLMELEVTSVSKRAQSVAKSAAAIFVLTSEDIRRSSATSIPELLRMVPGLQVARIDANRYAITARGFNSLFANKLLVLMDGRSLYNPLFSGVYWDSQDTLLSDIERIEVIRGPGATVWGANAVNGVINIITKSAADTHGGFVEGGGGTEERGFSGVRYGAAIGEESHVRVYAKALSRDATEAVIGGDNYDSMESYQTGFRFDWAAGADAVTVQGDVLDGSEGAQFVSAADSARGAAPTRIRSDFSGGNLLANWRHEISADSQTSLQFYYDRVNRDDLLEQGSDTLDLDFQHQLRTSRQNQLVWGLGYRRVDFEALQRLAFLRLDPDKDQTDLYSGFLQDEYRFEDVPLTLIVGSKFEHNDFTGHEVQPSIRLTYEPNLKETWWAAVSRAVRSPNFATEGVRLDTGLIPLAGGEFALLQAMGRDRFVSEELTAYELGYRATVGDALSIDTAVFFNEYDNVQSVETGAMPAFSAERGQVVVPLPFENEIEADTYGGELVLTWQATSQWRLQGWYAYLDTYEDFTRTTDQFSTSEGLSPKHQVGLRSLYSLGEDWEFDTHLRFVDDLDKLDIDSYFQLDARLGWRPYPGVELSLVGTNLLEQEHEEYRETFLLFSPTQIERGVFAKVTWRF
jgi:iron complex outermembrane receptor protein